MTRPALESIPHEFAGHKVGRLSNGHLQLDYLEEAGPRLVRLSLCSDSGSPGANLLAECPDLHWATPYGEFYLYGGHRLWHAPETLDRTSVPDDRNLQVQALPGAVRLYQPADPYTHIAKAIEIRLHPNEPCVDLVHQLVNCGSWPVELAPWAITQLPLGGTASIPQPDAPVDRDGLAPNRSLVAWPYARWEDPRLQLQDRWVRVAALPIEQPFKIGQFNRLGWLAYQRGEVLFVKRFTPQPGLPHPDLGCNVEIYAGPRFIELETLGPLTRLEPGASVSHVESWEVLLASAWSSPALSCP